MFFGLEVKSQQNQAKAVTLDNTLKLSQAVLEPSKNGKKEPVSLVVEYDKKHFILCVLDPNTTWQCPLDILFEGGSQVKFYVRGQGNIHLTGYENFDDLDDMSVSMSSDEDVSEAEVSTNKKQLVKASPNKLSPKAAKTNGIAKKSRSGRKINGVAEPVVVDEDTDDSDDEDFDYEGADDDDVIAAGATSDDDSDLEDEDEDGDDDDDDDDDIEIDEDMAECDSDDSDEN